MPSKPRRFSCPRSCLHLVLLIVTCIRWISYRNGYLEQLVLHLTFFLKVLLVVEMLQALVFSAFLYFARCSSELAALDSFPYSCSSSPYSNRLRGFSVTSPRWCYKDVYINSFFSHTARLCHSLSEECTPLMKRP